VIHMLKPFTRLWVSNRTQSNRINSSLILSILSMYSKDSSSMTWDHFSLYFSSFIFGGKWLKFNSLISFIFSICLSLDSFRYWRVSCVKILFSNRVSVLMSIRFISLSTCSTIIYRGWKDSNFCWDILLVLLFDKSLF